MPLDLQNFNDKELSDCIRDDTERARAFQTLYERHAKKLSHYLDKVLDKDEAVNDVYQETWMRAHASILDYTVIIRNFESYLFRIARNLCLNRRRDSKEQLTIEDFHIITSRSSEYEQQELLNLINRALELLDEEYRDAFVLHEIEGFSYEEMSEICSESVTALKSRVWRARNSIKEILAPFIKELQ